MFVLGYRKNDLNWWLHSFSKIQIFTVKNDGDKIVHGYTI